MKQEKHNELEAISILDAEDFGVEINEKGKIVNFNHNQFVRRYLEIQSVAHRPNENIYYVYDKCGVWKEKSIDDIKRDMLKILDKIHPDIWKISREKEIEHTLAMRSFSTEELRDASEYINVKNGLLSLKTFKLKKHDSSIFSTRQLPVKYKSKAKAPKWKKFLRDIFLRNKKLRLLLQEITGYILTSNTKAQKFFFLYSDGSSGKSVYCKILKLLVGGDEFVSSVTLSKLNDKFERSQLYGAAVNIATENEPEQFGTETLKAVSSGDIIQIERKKEHAFSTAITAKLVFCLNNLPIPKDKTYAIYRRLVIVPFLASFVQEPKKKNELPINPNKFEELKPELEGILAWAIKGLQRLVKNDYVFTYSKKAEKLLNEYRRDIDPIVDFVQEAIKANSKSRLYYKRLYVVFEKWRKENKVNFPSLYRNRNFNRMFIKELCQQLDQEKISYKKKHGGNNLYLLGITLKDSFVEKYLEG